MLRVLVGLSALLVLGVTCKGAPPPPVQVEPLPRPVSFLDDVKPVLDRRCVVCHSCYNAACQLKLDSWEGAARGGSKERVYLPSRLRAQRPTRLFLDAQSTEDWRALDFHSVLRSTATAPGNDSTMMYLLEAKRLLPRPAGEYRSEADDLSCPADSSEVGTFLARHPSRGMPFGLPSLTPSEHTILATWLAAGAPGPSLSEQQALTAPTPAESEEIAAWESFLNRPDPKHAMTARYLYEHLFLAHLLFTSAAAESEEPRFYELVRSTTPPGRAIDVVATRRPYDDPGVATVFYRLRRVHSTIVGKTHMVVPLHAERLARYRELFIEAEWIIPPKRMPYSRFADANPFLTYAQIPPRSRYEFLLDHSDFIIRSFMQGPVCKGQVALNVIRDHFWVMFRDPDADQTVLDPDFLTRQADNLRLPNEVGSNEAIVEALASDYRDRYVAYYEAKRRLYDQRVPGGPTLESIWPGRRPDDAPFMTVYRHFDSASLHRGALGSLPKTVWVIDYAHFERIYYALVAGFDVFGNVAHQINVRRYMDYLRMEGELNFLEFLPPDVRIPTMRSWYLGEGALEDTRSQRIMTERDTGIRFRTNDPKRELVERVVRERLIEGSGIDFDRVNYHYDGDTPAMPERFTSHEDVLDGLRALTAPGTGFITHVTDHEINVLYVRVRGYEGADRFVSIVINRWHDNVSSLFFEQSSLDPTKDTIHFVEGSVGSYPNYFLDVRAEDVPDFLDMLQNFDGSPADLARLERYGIDRSEERFWELYDWFQARALEADPIHAGLYDLNRYYPFAGEGVGGRGD